VTTGTMEVGKAKILIDLAMELQARSEGMTIEEIRAFVGGSRRTAERYRDGLRGLFPDLTANQRDDGHKAWRLPRNRFLSHIVPDADELAQLQAASNLYRERGNDTEANLLDALFRKIASATSTARWNRIDPDIEALLEAEGLATHQGPRRQADPEILGRLREAILAQRRVIIHYTRRDTGDASKPLLCPYGFLLGRRQYLVAYNLHPKVRSFRTYVLANIQQVDVQEKTYQPDPDFDLDDFAARSFGSWYDDNPVEVVWRFSKDAAEDAAAFVFHPRQVLEPQQDGTLIVRFSATGTREMCWHLFTWGPDVEILEPVSLREEFGAMLEILQDSMKSEHAA